MTNQQIVDTLRRTIDTLTRFIESTSTPQNARDRAVKTRANLQADLDRLAQREQQGRLI
jgi:uncharacterized protein (UPF0147 family)